MSFLRNEVTRWGVRLSAALLAGLGGLGAFETLTDHSNDQALGLADSWSNTQEWYPGSSTPAEVGFKNSYDETRLDKWASLEAGGVEAVVMVVGAIGLYKTRKPWN